jgi:hypothetical protein
LFNSIDVGKAAQPVAIFSASRTEPPCESYRARQLVLMSQAGTLANERNLAKPIGKVFESGSSESVPTAL